MRRRATAPSDDWLSRLQAVPTFDQSNGLVAAAQNEERYAESAHTVAPEHLNGVSRHFH